MPIVRPQLVCKHEPYHDALEAAKGLPASVKMRGREKTFFLAGYFRFTWEEINRDSCNGLGFSLNQKVLVILKVSF